MLLHLFPYFSCLCCKLMQLPVHVRICSVVCHICHKSKHVVCTPLFIINIFPVISVLFPEKLCLANAHLISLNLLKINMKVSIRSAQLLQ